MRYFTLILIALIINGCYLLNFEKHHWKEQYSIQPNTGIFIGKFALMDGFKDKQVVFYLIDSSRVKTVAYDTLKENAGNIIFKNLSAGKYYIDAHTLPFIVDYKPVTNLGGSVITTENCDKVFIEIKKDTITVGSGLVTDNKSAIRYAQSPHEPVIGGDNNIKPPYSKNECWLGSKYVILNDSTYILYTSTEQ